MPRAISDLRTAPAPRVRTAVYGAIRLGWFPHTSHTLLLFCCLVPLAYLPRKPQRRNTRRAACCVTTSEGHYLFIVGVRVSLAPRLKAWGGGAFLVLPRASAMGGKRFNRQRAFHASSEAYRAARTVACALTCILRATMLFSRRKHTTGNFSSVVPLWHFAPCAITLLFSGVRVAVGDRVPMVPALFLFAWRSGKTQHAGVARAHRSAQPTRRNVAREGFQLPLEDRGRIYLAYGARQLPAPLPPPRNILRRFYLRLPERKNTFHFC